MNQALLIIDLQNDYFSGGSMELANIEKTALYSQRLLQNFRNKKLPNFHQGTR